jgi:hypothetical protein
MKLTLPILALGLAATLAGCGASTATTTAPTVAVQPIELKSSAVTAAGALSAHYACDPSAGLPPVKWGVLPASTVGVAVGVFELSEVRRTPRGTYRAKISPPRVVVTSLSSTTHQLSFDHPPHGALAEPAHYSLCPAKGATGYYAIRVYALRTAINSGGGLSKAATIKEASGSAVGLGSLVFHYRRA